MEYEVAIVGTGFSGLGMAVLLQKAGIDSFVLLEKAERVGGTWRDNSYPGAACDIPSHLYSFSFEPNPQWTRAYSSQKEILAYLEHCARKHELIDRIRFGYEVEEARFDEAKALWTLRARDGREVRARSLVLGNGALHLPSYPTIAGRERFEGTSFHSSRWNHDYDLRGKTVAVIGTGASAIQFVPQIAPYVRKLHLFQRTPPWILPKPDGPFQPLTKTLFEGAPPLQRAFRSLIYWRHEWRALAFLSESPLMEAMSALARRHIARHIKSRELRAAVTPNYRMGCKRILISNDYYPALVRQNVELVTEKIESIGARGVLTRDGRERDVDAIIYGTGFTATKYLSAIRIVGRDGRDLNELWKSSPRTYLGITVAGFPNLYLMMGPNTVLAHNSMIFMLEAQARYALQGICTLRERGVRAIDVRPDVQAEFDSWLRTHMQGTVWLSGCRSWYLDEEGHNPVLWPGYTVDYWNRTRKLDPDDYALTS